MGNQMNRFISGSKKAGNRLLKIPAIQLIYLTMKKLGDIDGTQRAASVAYFAFLSVFPLILGLISVFGFFLPSANLQEKLLNFVGDNIPGATSILKQNIAGIIELRGALGIFSIIILFWGASAMFGAISLAINRAWDIYPGRRSFFIRKAGEIGMVSGIGILFLISLATSTFMSVILKALNIPAANLIIVDLSSRLIAFLLMAGVFLLLYKFIPHTKTYWRYTWPGALLAAILFEAARSLFVFYINNFANYQLIYGTITSIIVLLVWIYYSAFIMILGAEFTYQYSLMRSPVTGGSGAGK
jgi:membrane protein